MSKKLILLGAIIIIFAVAALIVSRNKSQSPEKNSTPEKTNINNSAKQKENNDSPSKGNETQADSKTKKFKMIAKRFTYDPQAIIVNQGDKVIIDITSEDVPHSFTLLDFGDPQEGGINEFLSPGKEVTVEFIADKKGEFVFGCDVACGSGHLDMLGKLIVK